MCNRNIDDIACTVPFGKYRLSTLNVQANRFTDIFQTLYISEDDFELGKMTTKMNIVNFMFFEYNDIIFSDIEKEQFTKIMEYMQPHYDQILIDLCKNIIYYLKSEDKKYWIDSFNQTYNTHTINVMSHIHNYMNKN